MARKASVRYTAKVDSAGRVLIPAELRHQLGIRPGGTLSMIPGTSGRLVLEPRASVVKEAQEYFRSLGPTHEVWSDELIAERRREARREAED
jgi:AbrB family transcriptional regulator, stage V sporulation protein T